MRVLLKMSYTVSPEMFRIRMHCFFRKFHREYSRAAVKKSACCSIRHNSLLFFKLSTLNTRFLKVILWTLLRVVV